MDMKLMFRFFFHVAAMNFHDFNGEINVVSFKWI